MDGPGLADPRWASLGNPTHDATSFNTQPAFVTPYTTRGGLTYHVYLGDNWVHAGPEGLPEAGYAWLPLRFGTDGVHLDRVAAWDLEDPFARSLAV